MKCSEIYSILDGLYPFTSAETYDKAGWIFDSGNDISSAVVCLDCTDAAVNFAVEVGANLIICHHPLLFEPVSHLDAEKDSALVTLIEKGISAVAVHTNFDKARGGMNESLAAILSLEIIGGFSGENGIYNGLLCRTDADSTEQLAKSAASRLEADIVSFSDGGHRPQTVAVVAGSGFSLFDDAVASGADTLITGDCKYHDFQKAQRQGINLVDAGHFFTERHFARVLAKCLADTGIKLFQFDGVNPVRYVTR